MIRVTQIGQTLFMNSMVGVVASLHLMTEAGELTGHGYAAKDVDSRLWDQGAYPDQTWEFEAGEPVNVIGYFAMDARGQLLFDEEFDQPFMIQHRGDKITVGVRLMLITQGG